MKLSFSTLGCPKLSFRDVLSIAKDLGYDGIEQAGYCVPRLATVCQNWEQLARRGVEILLRQAEGGGAVHEIVPFRLSLGESVGKCAENTH